MENREAIEVLQRNISGCDYELSEAVTMAIAALEQQEKAFDEWCHDCKEYDKDRHCCPRFSKVIRGTLDEVEQQRWIPVTERLPEKDGDYLVTYEKGYAEDYGLDSIGIAPFEVDCEGFGIWVESFDKHTLGSLGSDWTEIKVTAWQPLPAPYQEDEA